MKRWLFFSSCCCFLSICMHMINGAQKFDEASRDGQLPIAASNVKMRANCKNEFLMFSCESPALRASPLSDSFFDIFNWFFR